jgi:hypothetical protein
LTTASNSSTKQRLAHCRSSLSVPADVHPAPAAASAAALAAAAVEVILAAPKKVPKEEKLYVERPDFGKVR